MKSSGYRTEGAYLDVGDIVGAMAEHWSGQRPSGRHVGHLARLWRVRPYGSASASERESTCPLGQPGPSGLTHPCVRNIDRQQLG